MHTGSKSSTRINVKDHFILIFCLYFFPGRYDQDIIYIELMEILFPVVDPVLIFCLGFFDGSFSDVHKISQVVQCFTDIFEDCFFICIFFQIEVQIGNAIIRRSLRHNVYKHLCFIFFCQRLLVLNFHTFNSNFSKCADHDIFGFCFRFYCKTVPLHRLFSISFYFLTFLFSQKNSGKRGDGFLYCKISMQVPQVPRLQWHPPDNAVSVPV